MFRAIVVVIVFCFLSACSAEVDVSRLSNDVRLFPILPMGARQSENTVCKGETKEFLDKLENLTLWAYEMWDSSAKTPLGVMRGNLFQIGDYDECLTAQSPFRTQYCLANVELSIPESYAPHDKYMIKHDSSGSALSKLYNTNDHTRIPKNNIHVGICVPASCSYIDIETALNVYFKSGKLNNSRNITYKATVMQDKCQTLHSEEIFDGWDVAFCLIMCIIFVLVVISTIYDFYRKKADIKSKNDMKPFSQKLYLSFSAKKNFMDLSRGGAASEPLSHLYGLRTVSICMIIMDHRFGTFLSGPLMNREYIDKEYRSFATIVICHGDLFVDTFFLISGLLVTYGLLQTFEKKRMSPLLMIFLRYIRLTPAYAIVIFYYATIFYKTGYGPLWKMIIGPERVDCRNSWWTGILYINNYVNDDHMCMVHSWYLPCDMHLFIIAIPVLILINQRRQAGLATLLLLLLISILIPFGITMYYHLPGVMHFYNDALIAPKVHPVFRTMYTKTHTRASSYIIGMFGGFVYFKLRDSTLKISTWTSHVITLISALLLVGAMGAGSVFYDPYREFSDLESALYASLHRPAWALGTIMLLLNASYGHVRLVKAVLSWKPLVPISKLVYGAYLIHMIFSLRGVGIKKTAEYFNYFDVLSMALSDMVLAFASALLLYVLIEAPFRNLFNVLMNPRRKQTAPKNEVALQESIMNKEESSHL